MNGNIQIGLLSKAGLVALHRLIQEVRTYIHAYAPQYTNLGYTVIRTHFRHSAGSPEYQ